MNTHMDMTYDFISLAHKWPSAIVSRDKISEFSGGLLHPRTMANLDAKGLGPKKIKVGGKVAYPVEELCEWMASRVES